MGIPEAFVVIWAHQLPSDWLHVHGPTPVEFRDTPSWKASTSEISPEGSAVPPVGGETICIQEAAVLVKVAVPVKLVGGGSQM